MVKTLTILGGLILVGFFLFGGSTLVKPAIATIKADLETIRSGISERDQDVMTSMELGSMGDKIG